MSRVNVAAEVEKGAAIKRQLKVWESLLECRIQLQKVLKRTNKTFAFNENFSCYLFLVLAVIYHCPTFSISPKLMTSSVDVFAFTNIRGSANRKAEY